MPRTKTKTKTLKKENPNAIGNPMGAAVDKDASARFKRLFKNGKRKPSPNTPAAVRKAVVEYLDDCYKRKASATITGLTLYLGISKRQLRRYESKNEELRETIKTAKNFIQNHYEELLVHGKGSTPGIIFALKQIGWTDKQEVEHKGAVAIIATDEDDL